MPSQRFGKEDEIFLERLRQLVSTRLDPVKWNVHRLTLVSYATAMLDVFGENIATVSLSSNHCLPP